MDLGTGEYMAKFTATSAGAYQVSIKHHGSNIGGSPFPAEVLHTSIEADCSYVVQEGLEKAGSGQQVIGHSERTLCLLDKLNTYSAIALHVNCSGILIGLTSCMAQ